MDAGYGNDTRLRTEITALGLSYVAGIGPNTSVWPPGAGPLPAQPGKGIGRPPKLLRRDLQHQPIAAKALALRLPAEAWQTITWREGAADWLSSRFARQRVRPAHRDTLLTEGRFDIDPQIIGSEAFVHNGRTYAYFGIFPALLRLPLVPFHALGTVPFGQVSCLAAILIGGTAQAAAFAIALRGAANGPVPRLIFVALVVVGLYSGPGLMLGYSSMIYHEPMLWGWALAAVFVAIAMHGLLRLRRFSTGLLTSMAALAGCCLLNSALDRHGPGCDRVFAAVAVAPLRGGTSTYNPRTDATVAAASLLGSVLVLVVFAGVVGLINKRRWGNPLPFGDLHEQLYIMAMYPDRPSRMDHYGLFNIGHHPGVSPALLNM